MSIQALHLTVAAAMVTWGSLRL